ncbi:unnamed protein product, partial [Rotaria socialis]
SKDYADDIRSRIRDNTTFGYQYYGGTWEDRIRTGTAHLSVVGLDGDAVALTSTVNLYFGSKVLGPETDIIYNDQMDDFSTPNTINSFGVPASPANFIAPGKRPVSSMAPLVEILQNLKNRGHNVTCGSFGGSVIQGIEWRDEVNEYWANCDIRKGGAPDGLS